MADENPQSDSPESPKTLDIEMGYTNRSFAIETIDENPQSDSAESPETLDSEMGYRNPSSPSLSLGAEELLDDTEAKESDEDDELFNLSPVKVEFSGNNLGSFWRPKPRFSERPAEISPLSTDVGSGLMNLGNTCFLNAVLQCLMHTVPLLDGMISDKDSGNCDCDTGGFCLLCSLHELVELSYNSTCRAISPYKLVYNLRYFSSSFERYQQEDAHEFLQCFLDRLENCYDIKKNNNISAQCNNVVKRVFGGRLVSKLKCCNCGHCSDTYEPCIDYSLEVGDADNLLTALQSFTKVEKIEDPETKFTCEGCKEQVSIEKQLAFDQAPSVASFHLKRFKNEGSSVQKIDKHVSFPKELDLVPFTGGGNTSDAHLMYNLFAIVVHNGPTSTSGHYYCYIRLSSDMWCKFDDSRVVQVHESFVLEQEAYILFYAKEGTPWFSSFIETQKSCLISTISSTSPKSVLDSVESPAVQNKTSSDYNASGSTYWCFEDIEIEDSKPKHNELEGSKSKDEPQILSDPIAAADGSPDMPSHNAQEEASPSLLKKVKSGHEGSAVGNKLTINPDIFLRSPSPEIYREDKPEAGFSIPREHLKLISRNSCKRRLERDIDDMETRHACSYMKKNMQGSRAEQLMDAMRGSRSESSMNGKRSKRFGDFENVNDNNSAPSHLRSSIRPELRHRHLVR